MQFTEPKPSSEDSTSSSTPTRDCPNYKPVAMVFTKLNVNLEDIEMFFDPNDIKQAMKRLEKLMIKNQGIFIWLLRNYLKQFEKLPCASQRKFATAIL